ncbi:PEP-CTERM sorting domain-containing protein [Roseibacillus persicicus]|uniref:PEP-CTERM protein-sorting domain-containing protein n=1 Tax=Roseibacillus persicicus TaxID=454148 RepID=A0A918THS0_9BACT|nr:PEP-CTERM sorting domain-containing protein [Roseibacillus persicicus]GHC49031.1 hypothetical protein GCM10007100_13750 [Roseibacillus persicicus]
MKKKNHSSPFKNSLVLASTTAFLTAGSTAATVTLIDSSTNNGSFDDAITDPGNSTGGTTTGTGGSGGQRYARTSGGTIEIPGWNISSPDGGFWGVNHSDSTASYDGLQSVVVNDNAIVAITSQTFTGTFAAGDAFNFSAAFGNRIVGDAGTNQVAYNLRLRFNDTENTQLDLVSTVFQDPTGSYIDYNGTANYTGSGATEVFLVATMNNKLAGAGQGMVDAISLSYDAIPEPSSLLLCLLGGLGFMHRRR